MFLSLRKNICEEKFWHKKREKTAKILFLAELRSSLFLFSSAQSNVFTREQQHQKTWKGRENREHEIPYPLMPNTLLLEY